MDTQIVYKGSKPFEMTIKTGILIEGKKWLNSLATKPLAL